MDCRAAPRGAGYQPEVSRAGLSELASAVDLLCDPCALSSRPSSARESDRLKCTGGSLSFHPARVCYEDSAAFDAIVVWAHQTSSSKADFVGASRLASISSIGLFVPIGEVDMKSAPPIWTQTAVETIRSAIAMSLRCSTARAAPFPP